MLLFALVVLAAAPAAPAPATAPAPAQKPTEDAKAFVARLNDDLRKLWVRSSTAEWVKATYITDDTERNAALTNQGRIALRHSARGTVAKLGP